MRKPWWVMGAAVMCAIGALVALSILAEIEEFETEKRYYPAED